jgi:sugar phosphate permease
LHNVYAVAPLLFLCGICFTTYAAASNATVQLETPDHIRGRVLGLYLYAWNGPTALASPLLGWLCAVGGTRLAFAFSGTCALAVTGAGAVVLRRPGRPAASSGGVLPVLASPPLK